MKKFKNSLIAFFLVSALALPIFANNSANISGDAESLKGSIKDELVAQNKDWENVKPEEITLKTESSAEATDWNTAVVDGKSEGQLAVESGIDNVVVTIDASALAVCEDKNLNNKFTEMEGGLEVTSTLSEDFYIEPVAQGQSRSYYVLRIHETTDNTGTKTVVDRLPANYDEATRTVSFYSDKFSNFVFGYTDVKDSAPVTPSAPQVTPETQNNDKPVAAYDDGGPFTTDACGNVFDRWGNEVYHAPVCVNENTPASNNGYQFVNTLDK